MHQAEAQPRVQNRVLVKERAQRRAGDRVQHRVDGGDRSRRSRLAGERGELAEMLAPARLGEDASTGAGGIDDLHEPRAHEERRVTAFAGAEQHLSFGQGDPGQRRRDAGQDRLGQDREQDGLGEEALEILRTVHRASGYKGWGPVVTTPPPAPRG